MKAYNHYYLDKIQNHLGNMVDIAVNYENMDVDSFFKMFVKSDICKAFEEANFVYVLGKSSIELFCMLLNKEPEEYQLDQSANKEYWLGYVLAYAQWDLDISFEKIVSSLKPSNLLANYYPYHEMDIEKTIELIKPYISKENKMKTLREKLGLSQSDLAIITNIPIRTIRAYEQNTVDLSNASGNNLYVLAKSLNTTIENLIH